MFYLWIYLEFLYMKTTKLYLSYHACTQICSSHDWYNGKDFPLHVPIHYLISFMDVYISCVYENNGIIGIPSDECVSSTT